MPSTARLRRLAHLTAAWGILFAVLHAYWAAGGEAGMHGEPADTPGAQAYIGFIALVGLLGAGVARAAVDHPHPAFTRLARLGGAALLLGVAIGTGRWLAHWSLGGDGAAGVAITLYFLLGGILFSVLAARAPGAGARGRS
jgi:hypothetical protein